MRFCNKVIFQLSSTRNALKVVQIKWGKPKKPETKILEQTLLISICQICKPIMRNCLILRVERELTALFRENRNPNFSYYDGIRAPLTLHSIYHIARVIQLFITRN